MIIDYSTDIKQYKEKILCFKGIWQWKCPCCGAKCSFHRHGTYIRNLLSMYDVDIIEESIEILRLFCTSCGHTHAILPWDVIPFHIYCASTMVKIFSMIYVEGRSILNVATSLNISFQLIYKFLSLLLCFLNQIQLLLRFLKLWQKPYIPPTSLMIQIILRLDNLPSFFMDYLHLNHHPLFLPRRSTISYPLTFGFA